MKKTTHDENFMLKSTYQVNLVENFRINLALIKKIRNYPNIKSAKISIKKTNSFMMMKSQDFLKPKTIAFI
jgi:hypothetical protein